MTQLRHPKGWNTLVADLQRDLARLAPGLEATEIGIGQMGALQFYYSLAGLTEAQAAAVNARVERAEKVAWQTCVVCGRLGTAAWTATPPLARVFCEAHKPKDWNFIET